MDYNTIWFSLPTFSVTTRYNKDFAPNFGRKNGPYLRSQILIYYPHTFKGFGGDPYAGKTIYRKRLLPNIFFSL